MKRMKRHKVKKEKPEASSSFTREQEEHDLAYYIHDRVELMHQVFSSLKYKELKAMAPECVRHISIDDLQELCTEELLGISSKRLCAILDGAEPPSDTESSSQSPSPPLETISLDSISSDDEILSQTSKNSKKTKKHKHKHSKKKEKRKSKDSLPEEDAERSRASRAGLTVLELLELQARARAIRAQLQKEQCTKPTSESAPVGSAHSSDNEVEIKEEPPEVVEISSEDEKPNLKKLEKESHKVQETANAQPGQTSVVKRINDLIITIPQSKQTRKIKLNRSKVPDKSVASDNSKDVSSSNHKTSDNIVETNSNNIKITEATKTIESTKLNDANTASKVIVEKVKDKTTKTKIKTKKMKIQRKRKEKLNIEEDHDEITLQLSDSEKMDLLEDLDRKHYDRVSSSCTEDSESSSETSEDADSSFERQNTDDRSTNKPEITRLNDTQQTVENKRHDNRSNLKEIPNSTDKESSLDKEVNTNKNTNTAIKEVDKEFTDTEHIKNAKETVTNTVDSLKEKDTHAKSPICDRTEHNIDVQKLSDVTIENECEAKTVEEADDVDRNQSQNEESNDLNEKSSLSNAPKETKASNSPNVNENANKDNTKISEDCNRIIDTIPEESSNSDTKDDKNDRSVEESNMKIHRLEATTSQDNHEQESMDSNNLETDIDGKNTKAKTDPEKQLSDGELTDNESSEVEVTDLKPEVVCISDEDVSKKKKKKKDKKKKKSKKKSDFRESSDQNFFKDKFDTSTKEISMENDNKTEEENKNITVIDTDNESISSDKLKENYIIIEDEILILSDDSSCYEVDTYLSKEPTTEEIEALSLRIDEINRDEIVSEKEIYEHEKREREKAELNDEKFTAEKKCSVNVQNINVEKEVEDIKTLELEEASDTNKENYTENASLEENISWKERYLDSKKVKMVLSTANIFNALRKKNIELKRKLEEKRRQEELKKIEEEKETPKVELEVGSVEHYNTLEGSTKYVNPVKETEDVEVTREMKRDAKQLLKMYKKLLKYNDMNRVKDPSKKKKKKKSKATDK